MLINSIVITILNNYFNYLLTTIQLLEEMLVVRKGLLLVSYLTHPHTHTFTHTHTHIHTHTHKNKHTHGTRTLPQWLNSDQFLENYPYYFLYVFMHIIRQVKKWLGSSPYPANKAAKHQQNFANFQRMKGEFAKNVRKKTQKIREIAKFEKLC